MNEHAARRAARLVRLYPRQWRRTYPDFEEVLATGLVDNPRGVRRDVVRAAAVERLRVAGVLPTGPADRARSGLAIMYAALIPFVGLTMGMWSQLHTGLAARGLGAGPVLHAADVLLALGTLLTFVALVVGIMLIVVRSRPRPRGDGAAEAPRRWPPIGPAVTFVASFAALSVAGEAVRPFWLVFTGGVGAAVAGRRSRRHTVECAPSWPASPRHGSIPACSPACRPASSPPPSSLPWRGSPPPGLCCASSRPLPLRAPGRLDVTLAVVTGAVMLLSVTAAVRWIFTHPTPQGATAVLTRTDQLAPGHTAWGVVIVLLALAATALVGMRRVLRGRRRPPFDSAGVAPSAAT